MVCGNELHSNKVTEIFEFHLFGNSTYCLFGAGSCRHSDLGYVHCWVFSLQRTTGSIGLALQKVQHTALCTVLSRTFSVYHKAGSCTFPVIIPISSRLTMDIDSFMHYYNPEQRSFNALPSGNDSEGTARAGGMVRSSARSAEQRSANATSTEGLVSTDNPGLESAPAQHLAITMPSDTMNSSNDLDFTPRDTQPGPPFLGPGIRYEFDRRQTSRRGRGRAANQGAIIPIANNIRDRSLTETRLKRTRREDDQSLEDAEETTLNENVSRVTTAGIQAKKRAEYSCDHCFLRKTRVHIPVSAPNSANV